MTNGIEYICPSHNHGLNFAEIQAEKINVNPQNEITETTHQQTINNNQDIQLEQLYNEMEMGKNINIFA